MEQERGPMSEGTMDWHPHFSNDADPVANLSTDEISDSVERAFDAITTKKIDKKGKKLKDEEDKDEDLYASAILQADAIRKKHPNWPKPKS